MDRGEPTLAPEWLKAAGSSSHSDEHNTGILSRNRLAVSVCDHDAPRTSSSSFRRSASSNGSMGHEKDGYAQSRAYSSFGRSHRDRDRDRDRDRQRDREKDNLLDNGYCDYADSSMTRRSETDSLRRSQSMVSGRRVELLPKRPGSDSSNGVLSSGSLGGGLSKVSFERDFPSLGAEEKQEVSDVGRVSSPGISTAINSLHISPPAIIGADGWTSALAEVPAVSVVGNGPSMSSAPQTATSMTSTASSTTTGLSMAETLAQAPSWARTAPPLSNENERRKELTLMQQYNKLIPVLNSSEKSKTKGARNGDLVAPKVVHQSSSQLVNHALRPPATKPDTLKTSQAGNFLVLNREKNGTSPAKDGPPLTTASRLATSLGGVPSASSLHVKSPVNPKPKANGIGGDKKPLSQAQDRNVFFNSLRKQAEMKNGVLHHHPEPNCGASSSSSVLSLSNSVMKSDEQTMGVSAASACQEKNILDTPGSGLESSVAENGNGNGCDEDCDEEPETLVAPDEEEKAFLESLGWSENAGEDALTAEEIESFVKKHEEKLGPDFKIKAGLPESRRSGSCISGLSLSSSKAEL